MPTERSNFPELNIQYVPLEQLTKNSRNPRRHSQEQIDQLAKSIATLDSPSPSSSTKISTYI
jgi:hypothetical protein